MLRHFTKYEAWAFTYLLSKLNSKTRIAAASFCSHMSYNPRSIDQVASQVTHLLGVVLFHFENHRTQLPSQCASPISRLKPDLMEPPHL